MREDRAWTCVGPEEYEREICALAQELASAHPSQQQLGALVALASATLRREGHTLANSRACCAEQLLSLAPKASEPELRAQMRMLFLLAFTRLGITATAGPDRIEMTPALPPGVPLPTGADPTKIADAAKMQEAVAATERHRQSIELWNAKQRALDHLTHLTHLVLAREVDQERELKRTLTAAMSLTPGLPDELRNLLANASR